MFIWPTLPEVSGLAAGDGLACGVGLFMGIVMSIFRSGDGEACVVGDGALDLVFDLIFRFALALAFGFDMFIPGMFCMSCPCCRAQATAPPVNRNIAAST